MNGTIIKITCAIVTLTLISCIFSGCSAADSSGDTEWFLANRVSLKEKYGTLPDEGTVGDLEYRILDKNSYSCDESRSGYYIDMPKQQDSPYYIVVTSGTRRTEGADITIVDLGMDESTLQILVRETDGSNGASALPYSPCCVLEVNRLPEDIEVYGKTGRRFNSLEDKSDEKE